MPSPDDFLTYTQWSAIATLAIGALTGLAFVLGWSLRFRLVGTTGFMGVLTVGLLSLSFIPFTQTVVPNSTRYTLVYDTGAAQTVIAVAPDITRPQLEATLQQAAINLFSPGRLGRQSAQLSIRARTVLHPEEG
ncbi:MAG TPA: Ycf51 family protein, partial [Stenomitos sp.]